MSEIWTTGAASGYVCSHACMCVCMCLRRIGAQWLHARDMHHECSIGMCMLACVCMCVSMYVCIYDAAPENLHHECNIRMYVCLHASVYVCMYVWCTLRIRACDVSCTCVCVYLCVFACVCVPSTLRSWPNVRHFHHYQNVRMCTRMYVSWMRVRNKSIKQHHTPSMHLCMDSITNTTNMKYTWIHAIKKVSVQA